MAQSIPRDWIEHPFNHVEYVSTNQDKFTARSLDRFIVAYEAAERELERESQDLWLFRVGELNYGPPDAFDQDLHDREGHIVHVMDLEQAQRFLEETGIPLDMVEIYVKDDEIDMWIPDDTQ